jgi:hypothetical protein
MTKKLIATGVSRKGGPFKIKQEELKMEEGLKKTLQKEYQDFLNIAFDSNIPDEKTMSKYSCVTKKGNKTIFNWDGHDIFYVDFLGENGEGVIKSGFFADRPIKIKL